MNHPDALRMSLVTQLRDRRVLRTEVVEQALREVPRHRFVPEVSAQLAYRDDAVVVWRDDDGRALTSASQPTIVATMLEQLHVSTGHRILEVGTGTGYNAALLSVLSEPEGDVFSIEVEPDVAERASRIFTDLGFVRLSRSNSGRPRWLSRWFALRSDNRHDRRT
jgi:protein-L-isoaspartate(D-aspartate) O-methyltransferase